MNQCLQNCWTTEQQVGLLPDTQDNSFRTNLTLNLRYKEQGWILKLSVEKGFNPEKTTSCNFSIVCSQAGDTLYDLT